MENKQHYQFKVSGKVQGVWFRKSTWEEANRLGVKGIVRNEADGSVYVEASASPSVMSQFVNWLKDGPPLARVASLSAHPFTPSQPYHDFQITR